MGVFNFSKRGRSRGIDTSALITGASIEVTPRTAAKIPDFAEVLPAGTRVYVAHIDGTPIEDMVATTRRLTVEGFTPMPHFPARMVKDKSTLKDWIYRYQGEANVRQALLLGGGLREPSGEFHSSMQLLETGLFDDGGFTDIHVAGHPEGNLDIDLHGATAEADRALLWKSAYARNTGANMAIVTQFLFDPHALVSWVERIQEMGVTLPVHVGIAGPAKLQSLIKYAISCGVGPSLKVLQKRALDVTKLLLPYEPDELVAALAQYTEENPGSLVKHIHLFPLGGIAASAEWLSRKSRSA